MTAKPLSKNTNYLSIARWEITWLSFEVAVVSAALFLMLKAQSEWGGWLLLFLLTVSFAIRWNHYVKLARKEP